MAKKGSLAIRVRKAHTIKARWPGRKWKTVSFMMAVKNIRVSTMAGIGTRQVIVGRCLGDRDDGMCFFAEVDVPWIVPEKWDWKKEARRRLDTFLGCTCTAKESEVHHCSTHRDLMREWQKVDNALNAASQDVATTAHIHQANDGPIVTTRMLRWDYPWIRHDLERGGIWCELCQTLQEPFPDNPSYQNLFVKRHAECGFPRADYEKSLAECNLMSYSDVAAVLRKKLESITDSGMKINILFHYAQSQVGDMLPERMSEEEAIKHITEKWEKTGTLKLRSSS